MTAEVKMRTLAQLDATVSSYLLDSGNGTFRWFDRQLQPNYIKSGTCVRVLRVSTVFLHAKETPTRTNLLDLEQPRFQLDVLDYNAETARAAASAIKDWLNTVDFSSNAQFASPPTSPSRRPNFILNQRAGMDFSLQPPVYVETIDFRIFDLQE